MRSRSSATARFASSSRSRSSSRGALFELLRVEAAVAHRRPEQVRRRRRTRRSNARFGARRVGDADDGHDDQTPTHDRGEADRALAARGVYEPTRVRADEEHLRLHVGLVLEADEQHERRPSSTISTRERRAPAEVERQAAAEREQHGERVGVAEVNFGCRSVRRARSSPTTVNAVPRNASSTHGLIVAEPPASTARRGGLSAVPPGQRTGRSGRVPSAWRADPRVHLEMYARPASAVLERPSRGRARKRRAADEPGGVDERIVASPARLDGRTTQGDPLMATHTHPQPARHGRRLPRQRRRRPGRRRHQGLRQGRSRSPCARRRHRRLRDRSLHRDHGPVGLGQVDAHAHARRSRLAHERFGLDRRHRPRHAQRQEAHAAASRPHRLHLPGVQPHPDAHAPRRTSRCR